MSKKHYHESLNFGRDCGIEIYDLQLNGTRPSLERRSLSLTPFSKQQEETHLQLSTSLHISSTLKLHFSKHNKYENQSLCEPF